MLSRDQIFSFDDLPIKEVYVDEWKGSVGIRTFSARDARKLTDFANDPDFNVKLLILAVCDEKGDPLWTEADAEELSKKPLDVINSIALAIMDHNRLSSKKVDDIEKKQRSGKGLETRESLT
jgi:hypothetical protein